MDHDAFIENPSMIWDDENRGDLDTAVLAELWQERQFRDQVVSDMVHMLDEDGGFGGDWDLWEVLAEALEDEQVVELYESLRDQTDRQESEWRGEFEGVFEGKCDDLPDAEDSEDDEFDPSNEEEWS